MSDKSNEVCERIIKVGLHADILKNFSWETLSPASLKDSKVKRDFVRAQNGILHNVVRGAEKARGAFRRCRAVNIVQKFRDVIDFPVNFFAVSFSRLLRRWLA